MFPELTLKLPALIVTPLPNVYIPPLSPE